MTTRLKQPEALLEPAGKRGRATDGVEERDRASAGREGACRWPVPARPAGGTSAVLAGGLALAARYPGSLPIRVKKRENCG